MRILSAFFTVLFTFINPCMMYKVVTELEACFSHHLPERLRIRVIEAVCNYVFTNNLSARIRLAVYITVILFTLLHLMLTCLSLYGTYSCRPSFIRPFLFDAVFSTVLLLLFVAFSVLIYVQLTSSEDLEDKEDAMKVHLRNVYVGAAFLLSYLVWMVISIIAYIDTKKLHADFMYWIVEERVSMRSKANVSSDLRSDRSSKGSRASRASHASHASRTSHTSNRSTRSELPRMNSVTTAGVRTSASLLNTTLSVPL